MIDDRKASLLRFTELSARLARREISREEEAEMAVILKNLGLPRDQALEEAKKIVVDEYHSK